MAEIGGQDQSRKNIDCSGGKSEFNLSQNWEGSDVAFIVEEKEIYASKAVLSFWSPVFKAMFHGSFKETTAKSIPLPEKKHSDILTLFEICHLPMKVVTDGNVHTVLPLAEEYQMETMLERCHRVLLSQTGSIQNLLTARRYRFTRLEELCVDFAKKTPLSSLPENDFKELDAETRADILQFKVKCSEPCVELVKIVRSSLAIDDGGWGSKCFICERASTTETTKVYKSYGIEYRVCHDCAIRALEKIHRAATKLKPNELLKHDN